MFAVISPWVLTCVVWLGFGFGFAFPVLWLAIHEHREKRKREQTEAPPQSEKLLRPPGYSLGKKLDSLEENSLPKIVGAVVLGGVGGVFFGPALGLILSGQSLLAALICLVLALPFFVAAARFAQRLSRLIAEMRNYRLGMRGEQAVGESLNELGVQGYRAFHDLPAGETWNIDHVVVGPQGVFVIETKARRRRKIPGGQPAHKVRFDGETLFFPSGEDREAVPQAARNAKWIEEYLSKKTAEPVTAEALVVLPGLFVETEKPNRGGVAVMNTKYLKSYFSGRPAKIQDQQLRRIIVALDEKCRDLEF